MTNPPADTRRTHQRAHPGVRPTAGDRLRGLAATILLLLLVAGTPVFLELARHQLLVGLGWDDLGLVLTSPASGTLVWVLVGAVVWAAWAYLTLTVALELAAATGRIHPPRASRLPRGLARRLVTTASLLFAVSVPPALADVPATGVTVSSHTTTPHTTAPDTDAPAATPLTSHDSAPAPRAPGGGAPHPESAGAGEHPLTTSSPARANTVEYTVVEDDSLWSIAQEQLGDPLRFTEIRNLNQDVLSGRPHLLLPGTVLRLPAPTDPGAAAPVSDAEPAAHQTSPGDEPEATVYVVRDGDTLSQIALDELGDADRYPDIARASADTVQPDGDRLDDPDHIRPGWHLTIPAPATTTPSDTPPPPRPETGTDAEPGPDSSRTPAHTANQPHDRDTEQTRPPASGPADAGPAAPSTDTGDEPTTSPTREPSEPEQAEPTTAPGHDAPTPADPTPTAHQGVHDTPSPRATDAPPHTSPGTPHTNPWAPSSTAAPTPHTTGQQNVAPDDAREEQEDAVGVTGPAWLLPGLAGAGAMLAAGLLVALRRHRATQWRYRPPGHPITPAPQDTVPVERTIHVTGPFRVGDIEALDRLLRALAGPRLDDPDDSPGARPQLVAVELTDTHAIAYLAAPVDLPLPWVGTGTTWSAPLSAAPSEVEDRLAPYPLLVSVGMDQYGHTWLLDLEQARAVTVTGDPEAVASFGRYVTAELLLHSWAENTTLHALATGWQVAGLSDVRHHHDRADDYDTLACVTEVDDAVGEARRTPVQGRDWYHAVIATTGIGPTTRSALHGLVTALLAEPGRAGAAVITLVPVTDGAPEVAAQPVPAGLVLEIDGGRLRAPELGWDLAAVGLTEQELAASVAIVEVTRATTPSAATLDPAEQVAAEKPHTDSSHINESDAADASPTEATSIVAAPGEPVPADPHPTAVQPVEPRPADPGAPAGPWSLLPAPTTAYVEAAATTAEDVAALAPVASAEAARAAYEVDPDLDRDVAAWLDPETHRRARLMLLGPVTATAYGEFTAVARLKALHVEALAYLALHPGGTTGAQLAEDFAVKPGRARSLVAGVRAWLGTDPVTGRPYVPDAKQTAAFTATGKPAYQVDGLLVDVDLFQRLHARAKARGADGFEDLVTALRLVQGRPFDKTRARGWTWLFEGNRLDHTMAAAIGDVAHLVCTRALAEDDHDQARWAAQVGIQANPEDETSRLDDITIQYLTGHAELARKRLAEEIYDRTDDEWPPPGPPDRTRQITTRHGMTPGPSRRPRPKA